MNYSLTEEALARLCEQAVAKSISESLTNYGRTAARERLDAALIKAIDSVAPTLQSIIGAAITNAAASASFQSLVLDAVVKSCANKFQGHFDGIMKAAAKRAADDAIIQQKVADAINARPVA